ncbi:hypothetical protein IQ07DRAFT_52417 [Pyrenochaeta sp. DS3sAY3a]|nr:hypothetical protein IQ07DRAFT_52417 [Pyrenochaeta sp. DS3sAY3a]
MRLSIAALASSVAAQVLHGSQFPGHIGASALAPRADTCSEVPKLCTGAGLYKGTVTTLTYVCPTEAPRPSTLHLTVNATTTLHVSTNTTSATSRVPHEPTTTQRIKWTRTSRKNTAVTDKVYPSFTAVTLIDVVSFSLDLTLLPPHSGGDYPNPSTQVAANTTTRSLVPWFPSRTMDGLDGLLSTPTLNIPPEISPVNTPTAAGGLAVRPVLSLRALHFMMAGYLLWL